jgi:hypothetical protein
MHRYITPGPTVRIPMWVGLGGLLPGGSRGLVQVTVHVRRQATAVFFKAAALGLVLCCYVK